MKTVHGLGKPYHIEWEEIGGGPQNETYTIRDLEGLKVWRELNPSSLRQHQLVALCDLLNELYEQIPQG